MKANILVIDDTRDNLRLLSNMLTEQDYQVRPVPDGRRAISAAHAKLPDLILLDILMPGMDGYEVCRLLKAEEDTRDVPIIFISALNETFDKIKAFTVGGVDYISKPFQTEEVLARVKNQLTIQEQKRLLQIEIERRKQTEEILYQSRAMLASVLNSSLDGIMAFQSVRDTQGSIVDFQWLVANPVAAKTLGATDNDFIGKHLRGHLPQLHEKGLFDAYVSIVETGELLDKEVFYDNVSLKGWLHLIAVKLGDGFALTFRNITERKQMELDLARQANLDGLTNIANRRCFDEQLDKEWRRCLREQQPLTLMMSDVDHFKPYNDTYGHQMGDECLKQIANALTRVTRRPGDIVARYGGEEFVVILPYTDSAGARQVAEAFRAEIQRLQIPHASSDVEPYVTLSIGIASTTPTRQDVPEALLAAADKALYGAKDEGRNRIVVQDCKRQ